MKNPDSRIQTIYHRITLFFVFIPAAYGLYLILEILLVHQPYLLSDANPQPVLYDTVQHVVSSNGGSRSRQPVGKRLKDGKNCTIYLSQICNRFPERPCRDWEDIINKEGLVVDTYFFKDDKDEFVPSNDHQSEIKSACRGYMIIYSFLSIPFWFIVLLRMGSRLYYRYWYLPRYGDEDED